MRFTHSLLAAAVALQPVLAQSYLTPSDIRYFFVTGASIDWYGAVRGLFSPDSNTANGPNHIQYLSNGYSWQWNTRMFAVPGAVTDPTIVPALAFGGFQAPLDNWDKQIESLKTEYRNTGAANGANSLFVVSASNTGNDILNSWNRTATTLALRKQKIGQLLDKLIGNGLNPLYAAGGRNFIFYSVLPVHQIPDVVGLGPGAVSSVREYVEEYNRQLRDRILYVRGFYPEARIYLVDVTAVFNAIVTGTLTSGPTAGYTVRNGWCQGVVDAGVGTTTPRNPNWTINCRNGLRARRFAFRDSIHVSSPLHCEYARQTLFNLIGFGAGYPGNCQYADQTN